MKITKFKFKYYNQVKKIYYESFPKEERYLSFRALVINCIKNKAQMYCLKDENAIQGFIYNIVYENMVFVLYLAVSSKKRSSGYGSQLMKWCLEHYNSKTIYLNIDEVDEKFEDYEIRLKRKSFYLKNGFKMTNYMSIEEECNFNILSNTGTIDLEEYKKLDEFVAKILRDKPSKILKKEEEI